MMKSKVRRYAAVIIIACFSFLTHAQPDRGPAPAAKPYRILTSGKQITVKSTKTLKNIMVWTASGHRIVEQKGINGSSYSFTINLNEKVYFLMIEIDGLRPYTEKIGI